MNHDFIPRGDEEWDGWQENYITEVTANLGTLGILVTNADWVDLLAAQADWNTKWAAGKPSAAGRTKGKTADMNSSRTSYEKKTRVFNKRYVIFNGALTAGMRADMRLPAVDDTKTDVPLPGHAPVLTIVETGHLYHVLRVQNVDTPDTREIPDEIGVLLYRHISPDGNLATDAHFELLGEFTTHDIKSTFEPTVEGKKAFYYARWINPKKETSTPSASVNSTIS